jgi:hypothetical protein
MRPFDFFLDGCRCHRSGAADGHRSDGERF